MVDGESSTSGNRNDWRVRVATSVGTLAGASLALLWRPEFFGGGFLIGMIGFLIFCGVGGVVGQLVGRQLVRQAPHLPPDHPPGE
jgi:hypothetical protein